MNVNTGPEKPLGRDRSQPRADDRPEALVGRVRDEYGEMPGLCLTVQQACRLWQMDATTCTRILDVLVAECFLRRTPAGTFVSATIGSPEHSIRREACERRRFTGGMA